MLSGKKLLVINGYVDIEKLVARAHCLGVFVVFADAYHEKDKYKFVDQVVEIDSINDISSIVELCKNLNIDGILSGNIDFLIGAYEEICKICGFYCLASRSVLESMLDKQKLKYFCSECKVNSCEEYEEDCMNDNNIIDYPVIVKPRDSGGSRGISVCSNAAELKNGVNKAKTISSQGSCIIEKFITGDEVGIYYYAIDGNYFLAGACDRFVTKEQIGGSPLPTAYIFPSMYTNDVIQKEHSKFVAMFEKIGIRNGAIGLQGIIRNGTLYIYDISCRIFGLREHPYIAAASGIHLMDIFIISALAGSIDTRIIASALSVGIKNYCGCKILSVLNRGRITKIVNAELLDDYKCVISYKIRYKVGEQVVENDIGTLKQIAYKAFIVSVDMANLKKYLDMILRKIDFIDDKGESMLISQFDTAILNDKYIV